MNYNDIYNFTKSRYHKFEDYLENFESRKNVNSELLHYFADKVNTTVNDTFVHNCRMQGAFNFYRDMLAFWENDIDSIKETLKKLKSKYKNEWCVNIGLPMEGISFANFYRLEHDSHYLFEVIFFEKRLIRFIQTEEEKEKQGKQKQLKAF